MLKKEYILALVSFLLIPFVTVFSVLLFSSINPEIAAGYPDYERNYRLLEWTRHSCLLAGLAVNMGLWFLTCYFLVKSKGRSYWWLLLSMIGPFGFIILTMPGDRAPLPGDLHQHFVRKLKMYKRVAYESGLFAVLWTAASFTMILRRDLMITYQAYTAGVSRAQIIDQQNASSGMMAFGEGLEVLYLVVLFYLLWPVCFNLTVRLIKPMFSSGKT